MIYFDNAATTKVFDEAVKQIDRAYTEMFFNPSATYDKGMAVSSLIDEAREKVAAALNVSKSEIYFTSCASESNNWAINSAFKNKKGNAVISSGEHACVYESAKRLMDLGYDVRFAPLNKDGSVNIDALLSLVDAKTNYVSVIHVSNETGVINDLARISSLVKAKNPRTLVHSDGVQAFLKTDCDLKKLGVDLYSISGHKIGAPKGIGVLFVKSSVHISPYIFGGGQENGMRSGTENVGGIVGLGAAIDEFRKIYDSARVKSLYSHLLTKLNEIESVRIIGDSERNTGLICCVSIAGVRAETLQSIMADEGVYIGRGSACSSHHNGNRVLESMGLTKDEVAGAVRISLFPNTSIEEIDLACDVLKRKISDLRGYRVG
jgi:cysteine desulfurase